MTTPHEQQRFDEFQFALDRGFKGGEKNIGILRWVFIDSHAVGFIPTQWAHDMLNEQEQTDSACNWHSCLNLEPLDPNEPPVMITQYSILQAKKKRTLGNVAD